MGENNKETRGLRVLLLVCAGALLVIVVTLASTVYDASQGPRIANASSTTVDLCRKVSRITIFLPAICNTTPEPELQ